LDVVAENYLTLQLFSSATFVDFMGKWIPEFNVPCRQTMTNTHIPRRCESIREHINRLLTRATNVCLTLDMWTSRAQNAFMGVTGHFILDYRMKSVLLACRSMDESHTAVHIEQLFGEVVSDYNLGSRVTCVVTDNVTW